MGCFVCNRQMSGLFFLNVVSVLLSYFSKTFCAGAKAGVWANPVFRITYRQICCQDVRALCFPQYGDTRRHDGLILWVYYVFSLLARLHQCLLTSAFNQWTWSEMTIKIWDFINRNLGPFWVVLLGLTGSSKCSSNHFVKLNLILLTAVVDICI